MPISKKSLTSSFKYNAISAIIITAFLIAVSIIYLEYHQFSVTSKKMQQDYVASQKALIRQEVIRITDYIQSRRSDIKSILKQRIKQRVYEAHAIASSIYNQHKGRWPDARIQQNIKDALRGIRFFNGDGYYFVHSSKGILQLHGLKPEAEGKNRLGLKDSKGQPFVKNLITIAQAREEGFLSYTYDSFTHPDTERQKLVFVKQFKPYNWIIGSGDYEENIEKLIQQQMVAYIDQVRFGLNSYIFVVNYEGTVVVNPTQKHLVGTNIWQLEDPNGVKVIQQERRAVENPEGGFIYYVWNKPSTSEPAQKVSFMKGIADWQWMIGSGVYLDDIQTAIDLLTSDLKSSLLVKIITLIVLTLFAVIAIIYQTQRTSNKIDRESELFIKSFKNASDNSEKINPDHLTYTEFIALAGSVNNILDEKIALEEEKSNIELQLRQSQKMEALGNIVGGIAHDFNNLLGIMMGYSELLSEQLNKNSILSSYATHIYEATKRGSKLTSRLLGISHYKDQSASIINLNSTLSDNIDIIEKALTSQVDVTLVMPERALYIFVDASDFNDALFNLCINAKHAMADSINPRLLIESSEARLSDNQLSLLELSSGDYIKISITDNGSGIEPQTKEHIFEPFFTTKGEHGTGLGLSQVYAFMKRSQGSISVSSTPDEGTEISLYFKQQIEINNSDN
ncbi:MAG: cache domain-containing protein [Gammaproteobacteria bacterium]|nr:cache domain-containing protein [Gammaproteobacteria bacterium]